MATTHRRWARHVHVKEGALRGWCAKCPAMIRRRALRSVVRRDGYAVAVRRLNFLRNVAHRRENATLHTVASRDLTWMHRNLSARRRTD